MVWLDANIINCSFERGVFPNDWKTTKVIPIPKIINTALAGEFRPINTLDFDAKIIEKIAEDQLLAYIEENNLMVNI